MSATDQSISPARDRAIRRIAKLAARFPELHPGDSADAPLAPDAPIAGTSEPDGSDRHALLDAAVGDPRDSALAGAIEHAVVRHWLTLVALLEHGLTRPWEQVEPKLQATLLAGAAQLYFLDRVPDHAAIDESVEWAKRNVRPKAGGFVNAVLRKAAALRGERMAHARAIDAGGAAGELPRDRIPLPNGDAWKLQADALSADALERLAQATSHHAALIARWIDQRGYGVAKSIAMHSLVYAPITITGLRDEAAAQHALQPHEEQGFFVFEGPHDALLALLSAHPQARVQDAGTAEAVQMTRALRPRRIADVCAGLGTKTAQLAQLHPEAQITASDPHPVRLAHLQKIFAHHENVTVRNAKELAAQVQHFDLVILDVPCSNAGVLARRPEAKYRFNAPALERLVSLQRQIIADSLRLLGGAGGHLLYITCSVDRAENQEQAAWLTKWHPVTMVNEVERLPRGRPGDPSTGYRDGGYACLLEYRL